MHSTGFCVLSVHFWHTGSADRSATARPCPPATAFDFPSRLARGRAHAATEGKCWRFYPPAAPLQAALRLAPLIVPMIDFIQSARGSRRALRLGGPRIAAEAARRLAEFQKPGEPAFAHRRLDRLAVDRRRHALGAEHHAVRCPFGLVTADGDANSALSRSRQRWPVSDGDDARRRRRRSDRASTAPDRTPSSLG